MRGILTIKKESKSQQQFSSVYHFSRFYCLTCHTALALSWIAIRIDFLRKSFIRDLPNDKMQNFEAIISTVVVPSNRPHFDKLPTKLYTALQPTDRVDVVVYVVGRRYRCVSVKSSYPCCYHPPLCCACRIFLRDRSLHLPARLPQWFDLEKCRPKPQILF